MTTRTGLPILQGRHAPRALDRLDEALPDAAFREEHRRTIKAPVGECWKALHTLRWSDLTITRPLFWVRTAGRGAGTPLDLGRRLMEAPSPGAPVHEQEPSYATSALIGRPWSGTARGPVVSDLSTFAAFDEPGWLKYGMDWSFTAAGPDRTVVVTRTLCQPTDPSARRAFRGYWWLIRPWSGFIRRDILRALAHASEPDGPTTRRPDHAASVRRG